MLSDPREELHAQYLPHVTAFSAKPITKSAKESTNFTTPWKLELLGKAKVKTCVNDLRPLLSQGTLMEQKAFLRSFVKRIEITHPHVVLDYAIPLNAQKAELLAREVLPFVQLGSPFWTHFATN